jgi:hypothetical protein
MSNDAQEMGGAIRPRKPATGASKTMIASPASAKTMEMGAAKPPRQPANLRSTPTRSSQAAAHHIQIGAKTRRRTGTILGSTPRRTSSPSANPPQIGASDGAGDVNQARINTHATLVDVAKLTEAVRGEQMLRRLYIRRQSQADRSIEGAIVPLLPLRPDAPAPSLKALFARAGAARKAIEARARGKEIAETDDVAACAPLLHAIIASYDGRRVFDDWLKECEARLMKLGALLPAGRLASEIRGVTTKGLAIIQAEAGIPIGDYRTVSGFWKHMGLAVVDGRAQRNVKAANGERLDYFNGRRRSETFQIGKSLFFAQVRRTEDGLARTPLGPYGVIYIARRAHTALRVEATSDLPPQDPRKWTKSRCDNDAMRVMTKALLRDVWRASRAPDAAGPTCNLWAPANQAQAEASQRLVEYRG